MKKRLKMLSRYILLVLLFLELTSTAKGGAPGDLPALHCAARKGNTGIVELLLHNKTQQQVDQKDQEGSTSLHHAAYKGHVEIVELLLKRGADPNARTSNEECPLHLAVAKKEDNVAVINLLVQYKAELDSQENSLGSTPLHITAQFGRYKMCKRLLELGACPNCTSDRKLTPLHIACENKEAQICRLLLYGSDTCTEHENNLATSYEACESCRRIRELPRKIQVDAAEKNGKIPLHIACKVGSIEIVQLLLDRPENLKERVNARTNEGWTPLRYALFNNFDSKKTETATLLKLLLDKGAELNGDAAGTWNPLKKALKDENEEVIELLLKHGAETSIGEYTPLQYAVHVNNVSLLKKLLTFEKLRTDNRNRLLLHQAAGDPLCNRVPEDQYASLCKVLLDNNFNVHELSENNETPLHMACKAGNFAVAKLFVEEHRANVNVQDNQGNTPLHLACASLGNALRLVEFLVSHNADVKTRTHEGKTPLHSTCDSVEEKNGICRILLQKDPNLINELTNKQWSPLHFASSHGLYATCQLLIRSQANLEAKVDCDDLQKDKVEAEIEAEIERAGKEKPGNCPYILVVKRYRKTQRKIFIDIAELLLNCTPKSDLQNDKHSRYIPSVPQSLPNVLPELVLKKTIHASSSSDQSTELRDSSKDIQSEVDALLIRAIVLDDENAIKKWLACGANCKLRVTPNFYSLCFFAKHNVCCNATTILEAEASHSEERENNKNSRKLDATEQDIIDALFIQAVVQDNENDVRELLSKVNCNSVILPKNHNDLHVFALHNGCLKAAHAIEP